MYKKIIFIVILIIVALLGYLLWSSYQQEQVKEPISDQNQQPRGGGSEVTKGIIPVEWDYADGVHTIKGMLTLPDPCYQIETDVMVMESFPEQVLVEINTIRDEDEICAQVLTDKNFEVIFQASEEAIVEATLNEAPVELRK